MDWLVKFNNLMQYNRISHCFTSRLNGVSDGVFTSLNMGFSRGDEDRNVLENYRRVGRALGFDLEDMVLSNQVHKSYVKIIRKDDKGKGIVRESDIIDTDGLVTNERGIALVTFYADCVPLFFYDPVKEVVGICHAGWKGTVAKIGQNLIETIQEEYGCKAEDILVGIGPSIGACCYEVGPEVKKEFDLSFNSDIIAKVVKNSKDKQDKYYIDLKETNKQSLIAVGVLEDHIEVSDACTMCQPDRFFSHRYMGANRGSQVGIIGLLDKI